MFVRNQVALAPGETFAITDYKHSGLIVISNGPRGAVYAFETCYTNQSKLVTVSDDSEGEITTTAGIANTLHIRWESRILKITNRYSETRYYTISVI